MRLDVRLWVACALFAALSACGKSAADRAATVAAPGAFVAIARGRVDVEGGIVRVAPQRDGVVAQVHGAVGDAFKAGDVLVSLDATQAQIGVDMAKAELGQAQAQAAALRARLPLLKKRAERIDEASRAGASSGQAADDAQQALLELNAEVAVADAGTEALRQKLKQAEFELRARSVRAPVDGRLIAREAQVGATVAAQPGTVLAQILPDRPRIVRAELNEGFVAKVKVGMTAQVAAEADSGRTYTARVRRIGDVFGPSTLLEEGQDSIDARDVECILDLPDSELRVGQRVQVRFLPAGS